MDINKHFSDFGSIVKTLVKTIDMSKVHIQIVANFARPGEVLIGLVSNGPTPRVLQQYSWQPLAKQNLHIPDELCMPHLLQKKIKANNNAFPGMSLMGHKNGRW